jgi:hypothetical protein
MIPVNARVVATVAGGLVAGAPWCAVRPFESVEILRNSCCFVSVLLSIQPDALVYGYFG